MSLTPEQARRLAEELLVEDDAKPMDPELGELIPSSLGGYHIRRVIASGGMGTVYEAEQAAPQRVVAIKVMKRGVASRGALRRFQTEAETLARLVHPGIAQIYEASTYDEGAEGVPYFVMEYVSDAQAINQYAEQENLSIHDRLELFLQVCEAVQHAHLKGIIHRDLKPANVLFETSTKKAKVIDFGVALSTDTDVALTSMRTEVGQLVGTLRYMSPEQCAGDPHEIDTRSDVYSLGVILYELLCRQVPYDLSNTTIPNAARIIEESEPPPPSSMSKSLRGDLETIILKAIAKDREKRYQSVGELAQDIRRFLNGAPIEARPPTTWMKCIRWTGLHPILTTTLICMVIGLSAILTSALSVWIIGVRAHSVQISHDGREARLLAFNGDVIEKWKSSVEGGISFGQLVDRPREFGGGEAVYLGTSSHSFNFHQGSLCAFSLQDLQVPFSTSRITNHDLRNSPLPAKYSERQFGVKWAQVIDVFPESLGEEIIAIYQDGPYSASAIRIHDLELNVLYQVWHDGTLNGQCCWLSQAGLLIVQGQNSEASWVELGNKEVREQYPFVLFSLRPTMEHSGTLWVTSSDEADQTVEWYKCFLPATVVDSANIWIEPALPHEDRSRYFRLGIYLKDVSTASCSWLFDQQGNKVPETDVPTEMFSRLERPLGLYLGELPRTSP